MIVSITTPTVIAASTAAAYLTYAIIKSKGIPDSISATAYAIKHKKTFTAAMTGVAGLMLPELLTDSSDNTQFLALLSVVGLIMVGLTPDYKNKEQGKVHYTGAFLAAGASQLMLALNDPVALLGWGLYPPLLMLSKGKNYAFWAEIICLLNILFYLLYNTASSVA